MSVNATEPLKRRRSNFSQMVGSLIVALLIVVGVIAAVTARLGPTSIAELRTQEEIAEESAEEAEEAEEAGDRDAARKRDRDRESLSERGRRGRD